MRVDHFSAQEYASFFVRLGVGFVFFLLRIQQLLHAALWATWLPEWFTNYFPDAESIVHFMFVNGLIDVVLGAVLLLGFYTRIAASLMVLHLMGVLLTLGYTEIAIRDLSILLSALAVALAGPDHWCLEKYWRRDPYS